MASFCKFKSEVSIYYKERTLQFAISDPKILHRLNLGTRNSNTSKIPFFRGSFCKFNSKTSISHRKHPEIHDQLPKNPKVVQIWRQPVRGERSNLFFFSWNYLYVIYGKWKFTFFLCIWVILHSFNKGKWPQKL